MEVDPIPIVPSRLMEVALIVATPSALKFSSAPPGEAMVTVGVEL